MQSKRITYNNAQCCLQNDKLDIAYYLKCNFWIVDCYCIRQGDYNDGPFDCILFFYLTTASVKSLRWWPPRSREVIRFCFKLNKCMQTYISKCDYLIISLTTASFELPVIKTCICCTASLDFEVYFSFMALWFRFKHEIWTPNHYVTCSRCLCSTAWSYGIMDGGEEGDLQS